MHSRISRRQLLAAGGGTLLAGAAGAGLGAGLPATPTHAVDWQALQKMMKPGGFGIVKTLVGEAFADQRPLRLPTRVFPGCCAIRIYQSEWKMFFSFFISASAEHSNMLWRSSDNAWLLGPIELAQQA